MILIRMLFLVLLGAIGTWFYIYTDYVLMPHQVLSAILIYTGIYIAGWVLIYFYGLVKNNRLNRDLKAYRSRHHGKKDNDNNND